MTFPCLGQILLRFMGRNSYATVHRWRSHKRHLSPCQNEREGQPTQALKDLVAASFRIKACRDIHKETMESCLPRLNTRCVSWKYALKSPLSPLHMLLTRFWLATILINELKSSPGAFSCENVAGDETRNQARRSKTTRAKGEGRSSEERQLSRDDLKPRKRVKMDTETPV